MKRINLNSLRVVAVLSVLLCCVTSSMAAEAGMAATHQKAGVACAVCHEKQGVPPKEQVCTRCHNLAQLQKLTAGVKPTNPHVSPHYQLSCSNCHAAHKQSTDFCAQCHKFDFRVP